MPRVVWDHVSDKKTKVILPPEEAHRGLPIEPWHGLDMASTGIRILTPSLFKLQHVTHLYLNQNSLQYIPPEIAAMESLQILDLSNNLIQELPVEIGKLRKLKELLLFHNKLRSIPFEVGSLFQLYTLGLHGNPLEQPLATYMSDGTEHVMTYLLDNAPIAEQPPEREWQRPNMADLGRLRGEEPNMSVFCYNVLCDKYATRQLYAYCPSWALDWDYRKQQILKEISQRDADLIMLQEVETREFYGYFQPELHQRGYEGVFRAKSRARNMGDQDRKSVDGCAIFFKCSKFEMMHDYLIEFERLATQIGSGAPDILNRVMPKDNIACGVVLEMKPDRQQVFVTNAHLTWDPAFKDVKVIQSVMLLHEVEKVIAEHKKEGTKPAVIVGGDFNSTPDSGVLEFMTRSKISQQHPDLIGRDYKKFAENTGLAHKLNLRSCYNKEMPYTNYTHDFTGIIDYIFYSADTVVPSVVLGPADPATMGSFDGCPNPHFPSDHFSIAAQLSLATRD